MAVENYIDGQNANQKPLIWTAKATGILKKVVREKAGGSYRVRLRRKTSNTHQFMTFRTGELTLVECPKGWVTPEGYLRYLRTTLAKMRERQAKQRRSRGS